MHGEGTLAAMRRMAARFETDELPGVELAITCGRDRVEVTTDEEGYYDVRLEPGLDPTGEPWRTASVATARPVRGVESATTARLRVPAPDVDLLVISDIDDTVLQTGAQRLLDMVRVTATNSALTRTAFPGVPELYRALESGTGGPARPFFYVSSSPWNLEGFLRGFLTHREIPLGPLLLRDLGIDETVFVKSGHGEHKLTRIGEVLQLHADVPVVLVGDSGQHDPEIYAQVVAAHPGRVKAVWIREVRLDPGDGRVETVAGGFAEADVPMVLAAESGVFADHAVELGLLQAQAATDVHRAVDEALADPTGAESSDPAEDPDR